LNFSHFNPVMYSKECGQVGTLSEGEGKEKRKRGSDDETGFQRLREGGVMSQMVGAGTAEKKKKSR